MSEENTGSARTRARAGTPTKRLDEAHALLGEMRAKVAETATVIDRLTGELVERTRSLDDLESVVDAMLAVTDTPVIVLGVDRRVRALTRGAADLLAGSGGQVGKPLSAVLPEGLARPVTEHLDGGDASDEGDERVRSLAEDLPVTGVERCDRASITVLPDGSAVLVLRRS